MEIICSYVSDVNVGHACEEQFYRDEFIAIEVDDLDGTEGY